MSAQQQLYLAVFLGSKDSPGMKAWLARRSSSGSAIHAFMPGYSSAARIARA